MADRDDLASTFLTGGSDYERLRPAYPAEAVSWLVPVGARDVADVGAGTGKFSRVLAAAGLRVVAVDPSADMLAHVSVSATGVTTRVGTGEATGLPDGSVDLVTFAQSWHWVDPGRSATECARILRPGGRLGLLWNLLDTSEPWVGEYVDALHSVDPARVDGIEGRRNDVTDLPGFTSFAHHRVAWAVEITADDLAALPHTRSYWRLASDAAVAEATERIRDVVGAAPRTVTGTILLPYTTQLARADRRAR